MAQPPLPHTITGSVSFAGNASRLVGRKTRWPGEPTAASDVTAYGPGCASGAPSTGSAVAIMSGVMPGGWAKLTPANANSAAAEAMNVLYMMLSLLDESVHGHRVRRCGSITRFRAWSARRPAVHEAIAPRTTVLS